MVSKTKRAALLQALVICGGLTLAGCPRWHSKQPPVVPQPEDPVPCQPERAEQLEGAPCAINGDACELECRDDRGYCVVLVCDQKTWRRMNIPPPPPP